MKSWKVSKTLLLGVLTIAGGIVEFIYGLPIGAPVGTIIAGIATIIIRFYTNTAITGTPGAKPKE
ncbi:MAG: hypothetical protein Q8O55_03900 [Dehalococcoidales bacterium]|nr:hypothetical protein [Dehalococcoidales bacterium]